MIKREIEPYVLNFSKKYPVISITGPRQSGKTTLAKMCFPKYKYVSLENPDLLELAVSDPKRFINNFNEFVIFDEVQKAPSLFSYIQTVVDEKNKMGQFILTGSQNFLLNEKISQSLSGRVKIVKLLPFSFSEIKKNFNIKDIDTLLFRGCYPPIYDRNIEPDVWFDDYLATYIERDVRNLKNISNLITFQKFLKLLAARVGQLLNFNSLANETGISHNTARSWFSILEAGYIVYALTPYYENFGKRIVKQPKIYFYDTGLVCALLGLDSPSQLSFHYLRGNIFENFVVTEYLKSRYNICKRNNSFFWRDKNQNEIDLLIQQGNKLTPVEIKSSETFNESLIKNLKKWDKITGKKNQKFLIYCGEIDIDLEDIKVISWKNLDKFFNMINGEV